MTEPAIEAVSEQKAVGALDAVEAVLRRGPGRGIGAAMDAGVAALALDAAEAAGQGRPGDGRLDALDGDRADVVERAGGEAAIATVPPSPPFPPFPPRATVSK